MTPLFAPIARFLSAFLPDLDARSRREEAYLAEAQDLSEVERRIRVLDEEGRGNWTPVAHGLYAR